MRNFLTLLFPLIVLMGCGRQDTPAQGGNSGSGSAIALSEKTVGTVTLKPQSTLDGRLHLLIPDGFTEMDSQTLQIKYPSSNRPTLVYTNELGSINIAINHTENSITPDQLDDLHKQLDASIRQSIPEATWMFTGFQTYHGKKWTQLEFQSPALDTKIHNLMVATSLDDRMLAVSFNVTEELAEEWLAVGREIIQSLTVTKG